MKIKSIGFVWFLALLSCVVIAGVITIGPASIPFSRICGIVAGWITHPFAAVSDPDSQILLQIRIPRVLLSFCVGAGLGSVGSVYQGLLGNPLADPYILGVSSGAALGASIAIILGLPGYMIPLFGFLGACAALIIVYLLARSGSRLPLQILLLSGVVVNAFLFALVMFILSMAGRDSGRILMWLLGSFSSSTPDTALTAGSITVIGFVIINFFAWDISIVSLGEEKALQLGIDTEKVKTILLLVTSFMVGAVVSSSGLIGFVGLIVPHLVRTVTGPDQRFVMPGSFFLGGIFLVLSDAAAKTLIQPRELPVGVITALCGAPFFLYLLKSVGKKHG